MKEDVPFQRILDSSENSTEGEHSCSDNGLSWKLAEALTKRNYDLASQLVESLDLDSLENVLKDQASFAIWCQKVPYSLSFLHSVYVRLFVCYPSYESFPFDLVDVEETTKSIVKFFFSQVTATGGGANKINRETSRNFIEDQYERNASRILRIIACICPHIPKRLQVNKDTISVHVERLNYHSQISYRNHQMCSVHDAMYMELGELMGQYKQAMDVLQSMDLISSKSAFKRQSSNIVLNSPTNSSSPSSPLSPKMKNKTAFSPSKDRKGGAAAASKLSSQKYLEVTFEDVQQRLYKNKAFLNVIESAIEKSPLLDLYDNLCDRVLFDKDVLVLCNEICRQNTFSSSLSSLSTLQLSTLMTNYSHAIQTALQMMIPQEKATSADGREAVNGSENDLNNAQAQIESGYATSTSASSSSHATTTSELSNKNVYNFISSNNAESSPRGARYRKRREEYRGKPSLGRMRSPLSSSDPDMGARILLPLSGALSKSSEELIDVQRLSLQAHQLNDNGQTVLNASGSTSYATADPASTLALSNGEDLSRSRRSFSTSSSTPTRKNLGSKFGMGKGGSSGSSSASRGDESEVPEVFGQGEWLRKRVIQLEGELQSARDTISQLRDREEQLMHRISDRVQRKVETSGSFEQLSDANRPSQLIERYSDLYCECRPNAMDALDDVIGVCEMDTPQLSENDLGNVDAVAESNHLKQKILFSVIVLAFRSVQRSIEESSRQIMSLFGFTNAMPMAATGESQNGFEESHVGAPQTSSSSSAVTSEQLEQQQYEVGTVVLEQLRRTAAVRNTDPNYEEVCEQLFATLFDYPSLRTCAPLLKYIRECVNLAWLLLLCKPAYHINYHHSQFDQSCHNRFHSSDLDSDQIHSFIWPALIEQTTGHCVSKGIVIT